MLGLFHRDRFGRPQIIAILFLLAFLFQCLWALHHVPLAADELALIRAGRAQWRGGSLAGDAAHSPLVALAAAAPLLFEAEPVAVAADPVRLRWLARLPFVFFALMLGGSLWYVARRLYGNPGGYIALALFCFSPLVVLHAARVDAAAPAAWGLFGALFTAIALAHTLYAPPRDRLRRFARHEGAPEVSVQHRAAEIEYGPERRLRLAREPFRARAHEAGFVERGA